MSVESTREVAYRLFAAEYDDASFEYAESDEERAPKYVVTPTGARVNRLFVVGVLTGVERVNESMVRARIADPTGVFIVYAGQYQPDALTFLERADPPVFLAITGKANTFEPEDGDRVFTSIRPESINAVDAETRDRWVVQTAEHTLNRIATMARGLDSDARGAELTSELEAAGANASLAEGVTPAIDHYGTTPTYLEHLETVVEQALGVVTDARDEVDATTVAPDERGDTVAAHLRDAAVQPALTTDTDERTTTDATADDTDVTVTDIPTGEDTEDPSFTPPEEPTPDEKSRAEDDRGPTDESEERSTASSEESIADEGSEAVTQTDELYEFDEEEREQIEEEHGLEFSTGTDLDVGSSTDEPTLETTTATPDTAESTDTSTDALSAEDVETDDTEADDVTEDIEPVLLDRMATLDEGEGADRAALINAVAEATDADEDAIEAAIDDALMGGQCYEPAEGRLKPI